ncbi:hypothetical protein PR202_gb27542 [Eleusine coracana subsp. coracana]|uniref:MORF/ORRM1/DAG-like MORF domain-containing protein n=1 Tax=Eleusine coracana subsp. coracana TaxID=191504 RepID=A0AAV5FUT5_ELECO|nr:hypothetical protein PR202_gb27542 [Eleusine coracana subsp. coracana]
MAWASRALLLARLRPLPAAAAASCRFVRPLASSRSLLPARSPFSPDATVGAASIARYCTGGPSDDSLSDRGYDLLREQGFREEGCHLQTKPLREPPPPVTADDDGSDCEGGPDEDTSDSDYFDDDERLAKGPPETQAMPGCDFKHWLVVMEPPPGDSSNPEVPRDEIIHDYIKTLAQVVGRKCKVWLLLIHVVSKNAL